MLVAHPVGRRRQTDVYQDEVEKVLVGKVEKVEKLIVFLAGAEELLPRGLSSGNTRNVVNVACSVPKCDFGTENAPE